MRDVRKVCHLMEGCDGHLGGVKGRGECDTCQYAEGLFDNHWGSVSLRNSYLYCFLQAFRTSPNVMSL